MRVLSTIIFCLFFVSEKRCTNSLHYLYTSTNRRYARARNLFPFLSFSLSLSVEDRRRLRASPRRLSLSCVFSNDDRVFSERFLNSRTVVLYPILSNFVSEPTRSREKTKILHSPLIEHGRRRDQSNELDHPVVAPRSVHGVSDAGAPMMQSSSSSSLSSCVRNVFSKAVVFEKSKSPCRKDQKRPKKTKRSRRFDFFAEKALLLWKRRRPVVFSSRFSNQQNFFPFFFFFFRNNTRKK